MIVSPATLQELTGYRRHAEQRAWLKRNGVRHFVRADGRPVVLEADLAKPQAVGRRMDAPNFEALGG